MRPGCNRPGSGPKRTLFSREQWEHLDLDRAPCPLQHLPPGESFDLFAEILRALSGSHLTCMGLFLSSGSLFGAEKPFFIPSPAIQFPERAEGVKGPKR